VLLARISLATLLASAAIRVLASSARSGVEAAAAIAAVTIAGVVPNAVAATAALHVEDLIAAPEVARAKVADIMAAIPVRRVVLS